VAEIKRKSDPDLKKEDFLTRLRLGVGGIDVERCRLGFIFFNFFSCSVDLQFEYEVFPTILQKPVDSQISS
jgi:hypothetical protein